jgi:RNA polymerase sigma-B factor
MRPSSPTSPESLEDQAGSGGTDEAPTAAAVDHRFAEYRASGDRAVRNALVEDHRWVARHCVRRFGSSSEPSDDLMQVALVGLVKAVDRFDPAYGYVFSTFAVPTVMGELRRHFRDHTWAVRVPRRVKDHHLAVKSGAEELQHMLGRSPTIPELASHCSLSVEDTLEALEAGHAYQGVPLVTDHDDDQGTERFGVDEPGYAISEARAILPGLLAQLPSDRERRIIELRFIGNMSQTAIAAEMGVSQVHVSRLLRSSLDLMREHLLAE